MKRRKGLAAVIAAGALLIAACSDNKSTDSTKSTSASSTGDTAAVETTAATGGTTADTTAGTTADTTAATEPAATGWKVDTSNCVDPAAADAPITGTIKVASVMPLSGGAAAAAFAPVKDGFEAYIKYANEKGLLGDVKIDVAIEDDQYNAELTPGAVAKQIDAGANIFAGIIGSANNLAVRGTLNDNCIPQLNNLSGSPHWGEVADYPWTTGELVPYPVESAVYAAQIHELYPNGAKVALFHVNSEFGQYYVDAFKKLADQYGITIVGEETVEVTDSNPPTAQITNIAALKPDVIVAVPLGAQCISFLNQVANAKAANPDWTPATFLTNTCASSLILGASGQAANGLYTSSNLIDVVDPANASLPKVKEYLDYMASVGKADVAATAGAGWTTAEVTVAMLIQAQASPDGLTRASIMNAARNFTFTPSLALPGVVLKMDGEKDPFLAESLIVRQYAVAADGSGTFTDIGKLITKFES